MTNIANRITRSPLPRLEPITPESRYHRALRVLARAGRKGIMRAEIAEQLGYADATMIGNICGYYQDLSINDREVHRGNLFNRGCVAMDDSRSGQYWITPLGEKTLKEVERTQYRSRS